MYVKYIPVTTPTSFYKRRFFGADYLEEPELISDLVTAPITDAVVSAPTLNERLQEASKIIFTAAEPVLYAGATQEVSVEASPEINVTTASAVTSAPIVKKYDSKAKEKFVTTLLPVYERELMNRGINPDYAKFLVAQDGLESGWNLKEYKGYNIGNITAGRSWKGKVETRGDHNAKGEKIYQKFRVYDNLSDYVSDKVTLLSNSKYNAFAASPDINLFADSLVRGGYAADPNYKSKILRVYQSFQEGGFIKSAQDYINSWNANRFPLLAKNASDYLGFSVPPAMAYSYLKRNIAKAKVIEDSKLDVDGKYNPRTHTITIKDPNALYHELAHASHPDIQVAAIAKIIKDMDGKIVEGGIALDEYWDNPREIYSRLMEWRRAHNIDPNKRLTWEQVEEFKKDILKGYSLTTKTTDSQDMNFVTTEMDSNGNVIYTSPLTKGHHLVPEETVYRRTYKEDPLQIDGRYNTEFILRLQDEVAENHINKKKDSLIAKLGGKL